MGEEVEEFWAENDNVAIIDFLDSMNMPYSCAQWGSVGDQNHPIIIDDGSDYNFHDEFHAETYPINVFIDHEMKVHALLDTMYTAESVNVIIQEMLDDLPADLAIDNNNYSQIPYYFEISPLQLSA